MFEKPVDREEKDRSRAIMLLSGGALVVVVGLIILVSSLTTGRAPHEEVSRAGSAEFDSYAPSVKILDIEKFHGERLNAPYGRIICRVQNDGDRVLVGLQLRGAAVGFNNETLKEKIVTLVPGRKNSLGPDESINNVEINLEPISDVAEVMDMVVLVYGLRLK